MRAFWLPSSPTHRSSTRYCSPRPRSTASARATMSAHRAGRLGLGAVREELGLVELVDAKEATRVLARRARLAAEARRRRAVAQRQHRLVEQLAAVHRGERDLGGRDRPQPVALDGVGLVDELRQVPRRGQRLGEHQRRRAHLGVVDGLHVERVPGERAQQPRATALEEREHRPREPRPALEVEDLQLLADLPVRDALVRGVLGRRGAVLGAGPPPRAPRRCPPRPRRRARRRRGGSGARAAGGGPRRRRSRPRRWRSARRGRGPGS